MLFVSALVLLQSFNLATAVCTWMSSPQNINTRAGNFTSPRWETPIPAEDECKWTVNISGGKNVILRVDLRRIDIVVSTASCLVGGYLQMPDGSKECRQKNNQCFIYSYDTVTDEACQRAIAMSPCKYVKLEISVWPPKFTYKQDDQGRSKGFSLEFFSSDCALTPLPTFGWTSTEQHRTLTSPMESTDSTYGELTTVLSTVSRRTQTTPPIPTGTEPTEQSTETTMASSKPPKTNYARLGAVAIAIILAVILVIVLVVFLVRYMEQRRKSAMNEPFASDYSRPEVGIYEAAHDMQTQETKTATMLYDDGYDDSQLKGRPTPVPRSGATREGAVNTPTVEGYDDIRLRPSDDDHHYEEVGLNQNGYGSTMKGRPTEVDEYSYDE